MMPWWGLCVVRPTLCCRSIQRAAPWSRFSATGSRGVLATEKEPDPPPRARLSFLSSTATLARLRALANKPMQKVIQYLLDLLTNTCPVGTRPALGRLGAPGPHRGLPAGAGAAGRSPDVAAHRLKHHLNRHLIPDWVPRSFEVPSTENKPKAKGPSVAWVPARKEVRPLAKPGIFSGPLYLRLAPRYQPSLRSPRRQASGQPD